MGKHREQQCKDPGERLPGERHKEQVTSGPGSMMGRKEEKRWEAGRRQLMEATSLHSGAPIGNG